MKKILYLLIFSCFLNIYIFSEDENTNKDLYTLGDQYFSINAGMIFPMAFYDMELDQTASFSDTGLSMGGLGSLEWGAYLNNTSSLGIEFGGSYAFSPNDRTFFMVPITIKYSYYFRFYKFEIPVFCGAGITMNKLEENFHIDPVVKPGISFYYNLNQDWSLGINEVYWIVPNYYKGPKKDLSRIGTFLETTFSAVYHF